ncbi:hypothetical protein [Brevibacillus dissolubilis]|nr:hypothetical protein [Brevibacillus dissolubilis]
MVEKGLNQLYDKQRSYQGIDVGSFFVYFQGQSADEPKTDPPRFPFLLE